MAHEEDDGTFVLREISSDETRDRVSKETRLFELTENRDFCQIEVKDFPLEVHCSPLERFKANDDRQKISRQAEHAADRGHYPTEKIDPFNKNHFLRVEEIFMEMNETLIEPRRE